MVDGGDCYRKENVKRVRWRRDGHISLPTLTLAPVSVLPLATCLTKRIRQCDVLGIQGKIGRVAASSWSLEHPSWGPRAAGWRGHMQVLQSTAQLSLAFQPLLPRHQL